MVNHTLATRSAPVRFHAHGAAGNTRAKCSLSPSTRAAPRDFPKQCLDLLHLTRWLNAWLHSEEWAQAAALAGKDVASLALVLTLAGDERLPDEIRTCFSPGRYQDEHSTASGYRNLDFVVRTVAAHAVLSRFAACLEHVCEALGAGDSPRIPAAFAADDLLAAMVRASRGSDAAGHRSHGGRISSACRPTDWLRELVVNEAGNRLGTGKANRLLAKRVRKHIRVFRALVSAVTSA